MNGSLCTIMMIVRMIMIMIMSMMLLLLAMLKMTLIARMMMIMFEPLHMCTAMMHDDDDYGGTR